MGITTKLRELLEQAVLRNLGDGILLSGGLDTSVISAVAQKYRKLTGVTAAFRGAPDVGFAKLISDRFGLSHVVIRFDEADVQQSIRKVVRTMRTYDPMEVRNDISVLIALEAAGAAGLKHIMTGDGGDELFAGYSFFFDMDRDELDSALRNMWRIMRFSSVQLAESVNLDARLPFLDDHFKAFAMEIDPSLKVRAEGGKTMGKWILRKAFENILPSEVAWRIKMPIEQGSGTSALPEHFARTISDQQFVSETKACAQKDGVKIRDKEHLVYYREYKSLFGSPTQVGEGPKPCPDCGVRLPLEAKHCRTCGAYPV